MIYIIKTHLSLSLKTYIKYASLSIVASRNFLKCSMNNSCIFQKKFSTGILKFFILLVNFNQLKRNPRMWLYYAIFGDCFIVYTLLTILEIFHFACQNFLFCVSSNRYARKARSTIVHCALCIVNCELIQLLFMTSRHILPLW